MRVVNALRPRPISRWATVVVGLALLVAMVTTLTLIAVARRPDDRQIVAFMGDSYTAGSPEDDGVASRFPAVIGSDLDVDVDVVAQPGSGYIHNGVVGTPFADEVDAISSDTDAVIIYGSRNDPFDGTAASAIGTAALHLIHAVKQQAPQASITVIGPSYVETPTPTGGIENARAIAKACDRTGVRYVDALTWFQGAAPGTVGADGIHPTAAGHRALAMRIEPLVRRALAERN